MTATHPLRASAVHGIEPFSHARGRNPLVDTPIGPMHETANGDAGGERSIDAKIAALGDWRGRTLAHVRNLIRQADPEVVEEVKWRKPSNPDGVPVWSHHGILCTGETYRDKVKLTFAQGASLPDPARLFNASLEGGTRRAIDLRDGDPIDEAAFRALVSSAVSFNAARR